MLQQLSLLLECLIMLGACVVVLVGISNRLGLPRRLLQLLLGAFGLRVIAALIVDSLGTFAGQADFYKFNAALWEGAQLFQKGVITAPLEVAASKQMTLFYIPYVIAYSPIYAVFGQDTLLVRIAIAFTGVLVIVNIFRLTEDLFNRRAGLYAAGIAAVFPYWVYLSTILYRDMLVILLLSQILYALIQFNQSESAWSLRSAIMLTAMADGLRPASILPVCGAYIITAYAMAGGWRNRFREAVVAGFGFIIPILYLRRGIYNLSITLKTLARQRAYRARGGGAYLENVLYSNWLELLVYAPIGALYFLLTPFPWQIHNSLSLIAAISNIVIWYPIIVLAVTAIPRVIANHPGASIILIGFTVVGIGGYGLIESNAGPAMRHRAQFQLPFFIYSAVRLADWYEIVSPTVFEGKF
jgi:4-amino-4-deoxy-L-arabinose transferase-like glycosyltransferase